MGCALHSEARQGETVDSRADSGRDVMPSCGLTQNVPAHTVGVGTFTKCWVSRSGFALTSGCSFRDFLRRVLSKVIFAG